MCGIYGMIGENNVVGDVLKGISALEYRGYDSNGIAYFNDGELHSIKTVGEISGLQKEIETNKPSSTVAIAHTRWATHGKPSVNNAHPQFSANKKFCLVHNGIIDNFAELKKEVPGKFVSETDSEVIVKLIEKYYNNNMLETLKIVTNKLKGSFALAILSQWEPDKIYVTKSVSPCVVGWAENGSVVSSDINGIGNVKHATILKNNHIAVLQKNSISIYNENAEEIEPEKIKINAENAEGLGKCRHYMQKEINEIPKSIINTAERYNTAKSIKKVLPASVVKTVKNIIIVGCGTAYHAGKMGRKFFEENLNINIKNEIASEFIYSDCKPPKNTLMIFVSQSGETADTLKALRIAKAYGLKTLAITNVKNSTICFEAHYVLYTCAGSEVAVASTKAYLSQLTMFYLLAAYLKMVCLDCEADVVQSESKKLIKAALAIDVAAANEEAKNIAAEIMNSESVYMIGRGPDYVTALEASLKLKEISYIHSEAYPSGEIKHGTISLITNSTFVFAFVTNKNLEEKSLSNIAEVVSRGGKVIAVSQFAMPEHVYKTIKLPKLEDYYMPLISVVVMQLIAYHTSVKKGINPDKPRSLAKSVTVE